VLVFANPQTTSVHAGGPGGGFIEVTVDDQPFSTSGSLEVASLSYPSWWLRLLEFKETHRLAIWMMSLALIIINSGFMTGAGLNDGFDIGKNAAGPQVRKPV
jgi:hypothetical protein